jgi:hypothetical protein
MRLPVPAAIVFPFASLLLLPASLQAMPTLAKDVVVEVEKSASPAPNQAPSPVPDLPHSTPAAPFGSFNSQQLDRQLQRYSAYVAQYGVPDILIVGSSRALQGVNPLTLQQMLAQQGLEGLTVYNFGINGATAQVVDWVLRTLLPPEHQPQLLIWADGSRAFNSGRIDHTFNRLVDSKGYQQLMAGDRPPLPLPQGLKLAQVCIDLLPQSSVARLPAPHHPTQAPERSPLSTCQRPLKLVIRQTATQLTPTPVVPTAEVLGFQVINTQFHPSQYFQRFPRVAGSFDGDYRNFTLEGRQRRALERVVRWAETAKIPLIMVNLPLTNTYLDASRTFYDAQFRSQMQRLAKSQRFTFIDLATLPSLTPNHYFADPSHLNQAGAIAVSTQLGKALGRLEFASQLRPRHTPQWQSRSLSQLLPLSLQFIPGEIQD